MSAVRTPALAEVRAACVRVVTAGLATQAEADRLLRPLDLLAAIDAQTDGVLLEDPGAIDRMRTVLVGAAPWAVPAAELFVGTSGQVDIHEERWLGEDGLLHAGDTLLCALTARRVGRPRGDQDAFAMTVIGLMAAAVFGEAILQATQNGADDAALAALLALANRPVLDPMVILARTQDPNVGGRWSSAVALKGLIAAQQAPTVAFFPPGTAGEIFGPPYAEAFWQVRPASCDAAMLSVRLTGADLDFDALYGASWAVARADGTWEAVDGDLVGDEWTVQIPPATQADWLTIVPGTAVPRDYPSALFLPGQGPYPETFPVDRGPIRAVWEGRSSVWPLDTEPLNTSRIVDLPAAVPGPTPYNRVRLGAARVRSFFATPSPVPAGTASVLSWETGAAKQALLTPLDPLTLAPLGPDEPVAPRGELTIAADLEPVDRAWRLVARNDCGEQEEVLHLPIAPRFISATLRGPAGGPVLYGVDATLNVRWLPRMRPLQVELVWRGLSTLHAGEDGEVDIPIAGDSVYPGADGMVHLVDLPQVATIHDRLPVDVDTVLQPEITGLTVTQHGGAALTAGEPATLHITWSPSGPNDLEVEVDIGGTTLEAAVDGDEATLEIPATAVVNGLMLDVTLSSEDLADLGLVVVHDQASLGPLAASPPSITALALPAPGDPDLIPGLDARLQVAWSPAWLPGVHVRVLSAGEALVLRLDAPGVVTLPGEQVWEGAVLRVVLEREPAPGVFEPLAQTLVGPLQVRPLQVRPLRVVRPVYVDDNDGLRLRRETMAAIRAALLPLRRSHSWDVQPEEPLHAPDAAFDLGGPVNGPDHPAIVRLLESMDHIAADHPGDEYPPWVAVVPEASPWRVETGRAARHLIVCTAADLVRTLTLGEEPAGLSAVPRLRIDGVIPTSGGLTLATLGESSRGAGLGAPLGTPLEACLRDDAGAMLGCVPVTLFTVARPARFVLLVPTTGVSRVELREPYEIPLPPEGCHNDPGYAARPLRTHRVHATLVRPAGAPVLSGVSANAAGFGWSAGHSQWLPTTVGLVHRRGRRTAIAWWAPGIDGAREHDPLTFGAVGQDDQFALRLTDGWRTVEAEITAPVQGSPVVVRVLASGAWWADHAEPLSVVWDLVSEGRQESGPVLIEPPTSWVSRTAIQTSATSITIRVETAVVVP